MTRGRDNLVAAWRRLLSAAPLLLFVVWLLHSDGNLSERLLWKAVPLGCLVLLLFLLVYVPLVRLGFRTFAAVVARRRTRRRTLGLCPACGYDLTGNLSGICPECGTHVSPTVRT